MFIVRCVLGLTRDQGPVVYRSDHSLIFSLTDAAVRQCGSLCTIGAKGFDADILHAPGAPLCPQSEGNPARGVCPRQNFLH